MKVLMNFGQDNGEGTSFPGLALQFHMLPDHHVYIVESQSMTLCVVNITSGHTEEFFKNLVLIFLGYPCSLIFHDDSDLIFLIHEQDSDQWWLNPVFQSVVDQIVKNMSQVKFASLQ
jgi:hypothetical protein